MSFIIFQICVTRVSADQKQAYFIVNYILIVDLTTLQHPSEMATWLFLQEHQVTLYNHFRKYP